MYNQVSVIDPEYKNITGKIISIKQKICDWENHEKLKTKIINDIKNLKKVNPFTILSFIDDPKIQKICSETFIDKTFKYDEIEKNKSIAFNKKPKIAYFSSDFKNHPVLHLSLDIFKNHDKSKFEIYGFSLLKNKKDEWNQNIENYFSEFIYVHDKNDQEISKLSRKMKIDIAIDLNGFTSDGRQGIICKRSAPIQINFLGYPGTMGAKFYDYIIADKEIIPPSHKKNYLEKVIYQENCYQPNIHKREISKKILKRSDFNLPENKLVYCNFNSNFKITPKLFKTWMEILQEVPDSIFWIYCDNEVAKENLKNEAKLNGIEEKRIIFAKRLDIKEHLKRIKLADIFLDTFPYGAHTTASDAIRMGLPLITIKGESFASRVSSSILNQVDLKE
jgi:predicted O-linked N-acetylglucosamine transferase (SPINDLY family)